MLFEMTTAEAEAAEWALFVAEATVEDDPSRVSTRDLVARAQGLRGRLSAQLSGDEARMCSMDKKPTGVAASQAAAFFVDIGMQETVEGFPVKQLDHNAKSRFFIVKESISAHCCFGYTVCDRTKPVLIHGKHYKERYETVCECFEEEEAILVCVALNAYMPEVR